MKIEERIWTEYRQDLLRFLVSRTGDPELSQELVQDTLVKAYEARDSLQDIAKVKGWLFSIARNKLSDTYRGKVQHESFDEALHDIGKEPDHLDEILISQCLVSLADKLPPKYRNAVIMADLQGHKQKTVAAHLELSLTAAKSRIQRGRAMLKDKLFACCPLQFDNAGLPIGCDGKASCQNKAGTKTFMDVPGMDGTRALKGAVGLVLKEPPIVLSPHLVPNTSALCKRSKPYAQARRAPAASAIRSNIVSVKPDESPSIGLRTSRLSSVWIANSITSHAVPMAIATEKPNAPAKA